MSVLSRREARLEDSQEHGCSFREREYQRRELERDQQRVGVLKRNSRMLVLHLF